MVTQHQLGAETYMECHWGPVGNPSPQPASSTPWTPAQIAAPPKPSLPAGATASPGGGRGAAEQHSGVRGIWLPPQQASVPSAPWHQWAVGLAAPPLLPTSLGSWTPNPWLSIPYGRSPRCSLSEASRPLPTHMTANWRFLEPWWASMQTKHLLPPGLCHYMEAQAHMHRTCSSVWF